MSASQRLIAGLLALTLAGPAVAGGSAPEGGPRVAMEFLALDAAGDLVSHDRMTLSVGARCGTRARAASIWAGMRYGFTLERTAGLPWISL